MSIEAYPVTDRASWLAHRRPDVTASVAAALFGDGVHPYVTPFQLWSLKSSLIHEDEDETPAMRRGRLLEPVALQMLAEERSGWKIEPARAYYRDTKDRIGATPDAFAVREDGKSGIVQIKTVGHFAFKQGWRGIDGDVEVPLWIAVQASVEAALTGSEWACVAALALGDGGLDMHIIDVPLRPALMIKLRALVKDFWRRVAMGEPYPPDYGRDAAVIAQMFQDDDGSEVDLTNFPRASEIVDQRENLKAREADGYSAAKERRPLDAELISIMGNSSRARLAGGRIVEAKTVRKGAYHVDPSTYRSIKIFGASV